ncbi:MAG TPA: DUF421 domain-containing protein [Candidatus Sulfomarinibacteraceae bacterium]|nr:DUF421 domain-containing protein [Candidatus Sulfomarinibacteraceae bacterium]
MDVTQAFDLRRMFLGDAPPLFYLEIVVRTIIIYAWALFMLRLMGKRGLRQLSPFDFVIIIALGSAVGDPMFYPEVPLLQGMLVVTVVVALERILARLVQTREAVERFVEGTPVRLVVDGRLDLEGMRQETLAREELFAILRVNKAEQLGQVKRAYLEQNGQVSLFLFEEAKARPGLPLIPPWDLRQPPSHQAEVPVPRDAYYACCHCGHSQFLQQGDAFTLCPICQAEEWTRATGSPVEELSEEA